MNKQIPHYLFTENIRFVIKAIVMHPTENTFMLIKRSAQEFTRPNTWDIPGGSINFGELHQDALAREVMEETGLSISYNKIVHMITSYDPEKNMYCIIVGAGCTAQDTVVKMSNEHQEYQWVNSHDYFKLYAPEYEFKKNRSFDIHKTDFISDMIHLYFNQTNTKKA